MNWPERFAELCYEEKYGDMACHIGLIYTIARGINPRLCVELGVRSGMSTLAILHGIADAQGREAWERNVQLISIDKNPPEDSLEAKVSEDHLFHLWTFYNQTTQDFAAKAYAVFQEESSQVGIDLLFIDADHSEGAVNFDLSVFAPFVVPGGYVLLHDTHRFPCGAGKVVAGVAWPKLSLPWSNGITIVQRPQELDIPIWKEKQQ